MEVMEWVELIVSILAGLAASIPLVIKLVEFVQKAIKEKNWNVILSMVMNYMTIAEEKFDNGAERKEWVLAMVEEAAKTVDYDIDMTVISDLIDNLCSMSKQVNIQK
jgi:hypothetical protein